MLDVAMISSNPEGEDKIIIDPSIAMKLIQDKFDEVIDSIINENHKETIFAEKNNNYDRIDQRLINNIVPISDNDLKGIKRHIDTNLSGIHIYSSYPLTEDKIDSSYVMSKNKKFMIKINHKLKKENDYNEYKDRNFEQSLFSRVFFIAEFNEEDFNIDRSIPLEKQPEKRQLLNEISTLTNHITNESDYLYKNNKINYNDRINQVNSCNNYITFNKFLEFGKKMYDKKERVIKTKNFKDKDGNPIPLKIGMLFKCNKCKKFEPAKKFKILCSFNIMTGSNIYTRTVLKNDIITQDKLETEINSIGRGHLEKEYFSIECSNCGHVVNALEENVIDIRNGARLTRSHNIFDIDTEKITLSTIYNKVKSFGSSYNITSINERIVFNLESGRTYFLPRYVMGTGKRLNNLTQLSPHSYSMDNISFAISLSLNEFYDLGKAMEKYFKDNFENNKYVIDFNIYVLNLVKERRGKALFKEIYKEFKNYNFKDYETFNVLDFLNTKAANESKFLYDVKLRELYVKSLLRILIAYNQNPYLYYNKYSAFCRLTKKEFDYRFHDGSMKIISNSEKKIRNFDLEQVLLKKMKIKTKTEKKYLNDLIYGNINSSSYYAALMLCLKEIFKDVNAFNKMLNFCSNENNHCNYDPVENDNLYLKELIKRHGETAVVNAITKKDENGYYNNYSYYRDTISNYEKIVSVMPDYKFPNRRLRLKDLHDKIAKDANKIKQALVAYEYDEKFLERFDNKVIDDVTFEVAKSNHELTQIGSEMHICVGGYNWRVEDGELFIVSMRKNDEYVGCLEITSHAEICQAKHIRNAYIGDQPELNTALKAYAQIANLGFNTRDVVEEEYMYNKEFKIDLHNLNKSNRIVFKRSLPEMKIVDGEIIYDFDNAKELNKPNQEEIQIEGPRIQVPRRREEDEIPEDFFF